MIAIVLEAVSGLDFFCLLLTELERSKGRDRTMTVRQCRLGVTNYLQEGRWATDVISGGRGCSVGSRT